MSLDRSLKTKASLSRHRNVLSRTERLAKLKDEERWTDGRSIFGLPKVANRKAAVGKKSKTEKAAAEGEGTAPAAGAAAAPAAAAAKAPAAGGKAAAPAKGGDKKK